MIRRLALLCLIAGSLHAAPPDPQQYLIKRPQYLFVQPNASAPAPLADSVRAAGGTIDYEGTDRLVVWLPSTAVVAIAHHPGAKYIVPVKHRADLQTAQPMSQQQVSAHAAARLAPTSNPPWSSGTYEYDGAGNITKIGTDTFTYDPNSRLTNSNIKGNTETYTYDVYGNLISKTTTRAGGQAITIDLSVTAKTNRLALQAYDVAGNLTGDSGETNRYDPLNMLTRKDRTSGYRHYYVYDADDERVAELNCPLGTCSQPILFSLRDEAGRVLRQFDVPFDKINDPTHPWSWIEDYVYRDDKLLGAERVTAEGGRRAIHLDHLGTPRLITNSNGQRVSEHDYFPFGVEITPLNQETTAGLDREEPLKFTGHQRDFTEGTNSATDTYNDNMHARTTTPGWGRFLSIDPDIDTEAASGRPQKWNRYAYAANNPLRFFDPDGKRDTDLSCPPELCRTPEGRAAFRHAQDQALSVGIGLTPYAGALYALASGIAGHDLLTGDPLTGGWRAAAIALPMIRGGRIFEASVREALGVTRAGGAVTAIATRITAIPDLPAGARFGITEIKDVLKLSSSPQLRTEYQAAVTMGTSFNLIVSPKTRTISENVLAMVRATRGKIFIFDPKMRSFTEAVLEGTHIVK